MNKRLTAEHPTGVLLAGLLLFEHSFDRAVDAMAIRTSEAGWVVDDRSRDGR
jgi:hypothetical protein